MAVKKSAKKTTAATKRTYKKAATLLKNATNELTASDQMSAILSLLQHIRRQTSHLDPTFPACDAPTPASMGDSLRIKEAYAVGMQASTTNDPKPNGSVETLIAQVNQRSRQVLGQAESLRRSVRNEPTPPEQGSADCESQGQLKDFLLGSLNMLAEIEYNLESLGSYLLG